jgi:hypothetical protein
MSFENNYMFEPEEPDALSVKVQTTLGKAMGYLKDLISQASDNLKYGQYETYMKDFAFVKFIISKIGELQELYAKLQDTENSHNIRESDVDSKIEEILKHVETYKTSINDTESRRSINKPTEIKTNPSNTKTNFGDVIW